MRLTIGQFLGLLLLAAVVFCIWKYWWVNQDRNTMIRGMNNGMMESKGDDAAPAEKPNKKKDGWI